EVEGIAYDRLEVSSPGLDRKLKKLADFARFTGHEAQVRLRRPIDGRRNFKGIVRAVDGERIELELEGERMAFDLADLDRARVVADGAVENPAQQIVLAEAQKQYPDIQLLDFIEEALEPIDFGRIGAQTAKQVILQRIRDAEREQLLNDFLARGEKLINGAIKRVERGNAIIEVGRVEAVLPRDQMIPKENLRVGDRVRA